jgi:hypothetical protein
LCLRLGRAQSRTRQCADKNGVAAKNYFLRNFWPQLKRINTHPLKTGVFALLYTVVSTLAIILCFVPMLFLGMKKIRQANTYWVIGIYWLFNGLSNLPSLNQLIKYFYTFTETPMVLLAFAFANTGKMRRQLLWVMVGFMVGESLLLALRGWNNTSCAIITGAGILLILTYSVAGLWQYLTRMEHTPFEDSMVFIYAALLFGYGSFLIIYIFAHYRTGATGITYNETDSFLLYYISLLLSALVTSAGLGSYGFRKKRARRRIFTSYSSSSS